MGDRKKTIIKEYKNDDITVVWKPDQCIHSKKCWKGLLQVFNPQNRPWVNMEGASTDRIKKQVEECPSGALSYHMNDREANQEAMHTETKVEALENGPLLIYGTLYITNSDGSTEVKNKQLLFVDVEPLKTSLIVMEHILKQDLKDNN